MPYAPEIDVSAVVDDIATHIKNQFEGILARVSKDQLTLQENVNMILNLPIVKSLLEEKKELLNKITKLEQENKELKVLLAHIPFPYKNNEVENTKNISLEVRELDSDTSSITQEEIVEHIKEKELEVLKKQAHNITSGYQFWKQQQTSNIESKTNGIPGHFSSFSMLQDSDDEPIYSTEEEEDDEEEDEDDDNEEDNDEDEADNDEDDHEEDNDEDEDDEEDNDEDDEEDNDEDDEEDEDNNDEDEEDSPQLNQFKSFTGSAQVVSDGEEEEFDVEEIDLEGTKYYTTDPDNGIVYEYTQDGEIGEEIGRLEEGNLFLS